MTVVSSVDLKKLHSQNAEILLAQPRGFCAGVDRAIDIAGAYVRRTTGSAQAGRVVEE